MLAAIAALGDQMRALGALFRNQRARERICSDRWTPLVVEHSGVHKIGLVPASFPPLHGHVTVLSNDKIDLLEEQFNLPPGQFAGDTVGIRRSAVLTYFQEG
jgi:hypothetical protein